MIEITNMVVQTQLHVQLNLKKLARTLVDVKYNPRTFSALIWHHKKIGGSCLVFNNGHIICQGSKSYEQARLRIRKYARKLQQCGYVVRLSPIQLLTASALANVQTSLNLKDVALFMNGAFEPEIFNGAVFHRGRVHFACFASGKIVITGITRLSMINQVIYPTLLEIQLS